MSIETKLKVTEIQRFCMHDGNGIRTTVFLKGCPLNCLWCHNPETKKPHSELLFYKNKCVLCGGCEKICRAQVHSVTDCHVIDRNRCLSCFSCAEICPTGALEVCGRDMTVDEILTEVLKDSAFYGNEGGVTLSGGEPFTQKYATVGLLKTCKERGLSTAVETCGQADSEVIRASVPFVDLFLWDIKDTDLSRHKKYTGRSNKVILENLAIANEMGARIRIRCILVNGVNTDERHYRSVARLCNTLKNPDGVEIIPYHAYGGTKSEFIGKENCANEQWIPTPEQIKEFKDVLRTENIKVI